MAINSIMVGRRIREFRTQKHMPQSELAEHIDKSVTYISLIETAKKQVSLETLVNIANVLEVTVNDLLNGNQARDSAEYKAELVQLFDGCTSYEKRVIFDIAAAARKSLLENRSLHTKDK